MNLMFCDDSDLLKFELDLDNIWPRFKEDKQGVKTVFRDWNVQIRLAMDELERRLRNHKDVPEVFELGRVGLRSRANLKDCVAQWAIHFIYVAADTQSEAGFYKRKADWYWDRGNSVFIAETISLDYDSDNDGKINDLEKSQPMSNRFIRG